LRLLRRSRRSRCCRRRRALRRRRWLSLRRRHALLWMFGWRRSLRTRSRLVPVRRRLSGFWMSSFGTIVRLSRGRTIHLRLVGLRTARLRCGRMGSFRPIARRCRFWTAWLIHRGPVVRLRRRGLTRRWGWAIRLSWNGRSGPLIRSRLIARPVHRLIRRRRRLTRSRSIGLVGGTSCIWRRRFPRRRLLYHWPRRRGIGRTQGLHFTSH
jgi:hypothetical protein